MQARSVGLTAASLARLLALNPAEVPLVVGSTIVSGGTASGILWNNAGVLASGPALTSVAGIITLPVGGTLAVNGAAIGTNLIASTGFSVGATGIVTATTKYVIGADELRSVGGRWDVAPGGSSLMSLGSANVVIAGSVLGFAASTGGANSGDTSISRISAGIIGIGTGAQGSVAGTLQALNVTLGAGGVLQLGNARAAGVLVQGGSVTMKDSGGNVITVLTT